MITVRLSVGVLLLLLVPSIGSAQEPLQLDPLPPPVPFRVGATEEGWEGPAEFLPEDPTEEDDSIDPFESSIYPFSSFERMVWEFLGGLAGYAAAGAVASTCLIDRENVEVACAILGVGGTAGALVLGPTLLDLAGDEAGSWWAAFLGQFVGLVTFSSVIQPALAVDQELSEEARIAAAIAAPLLIMATAVVMYEWSID